MLMVAVVVDGALPPLKSLSAAKIPVADPPQLMATSPADVTIRVIVAEWFKEPLVPLTASE